MKAFFSILLLSAFVMVAPAFAQDSGSGGGDPGAANGASGASGQTNANWGSQGGTNGDGQQVPASPPSVTASEPLLPAFCPSGRCYQNAFNGETSICGAGAKGSSPGQPSCGNWSTSDPNSNLPTDPGKTSQ